MVGRGALARAVGTRRANRLQFSNVSLSALRPDDVAALETVQALPSVGGGEQALDESYFDLPLPASAPAAAGASAAGASPDGAVAPLEPGLITLSALPKLRWQNLLHLETIRVRPAGHTRRQM